MPKIVSGGAWRPRRRRRRRSASGRRCAAASCAASSCGCPGPGLRRAARRTAKCHLATNLRAAA
eukprot:404861-Alexandrium_andersonii.AAC.1